MFLEKEDLYTAISEYQLRNITTSAATIQAAIRAAVGEAESYLGAKYDCAAIFAARGETRHPTLLECCKQLAVWYLCRIANTDLIFRQASAYREAAIVWLGRVAGLDPTQPALTPDLPLRSSAAMQQA